MKETEGTELQVQVIVVSWILVAILAAVMVLAARGRMDSLPLLIASAAGLVAATIVAAMATLKIKLDRSLNSQERLLRDIAGSLKQSRTLE